MGVGGAMTSFIFHDFLLVFLVAGVILFMKYTGRISLNKTENSPNGFSPDDVTGGPITAPKRKHDWIQNDSL